MIQLVLIAASQQRLSPYCLAVVECDNNKVVTHGNSPGRGLKEKQAQAEALRSFKKLITDHPFEVSYKWVKAHLDDVKNWAQFLLEERLNVTMDGMTKKVLIALVVEHRSLFRASSHSRRYEWIRIASKSPDPQGQH